MSVRSYLRLMSRYWLGALPAGILATILGTTVIQFTNKPEHIISLTITMHVMGQGISPMDEKPAIGQLAISAPALPTSPRVLTPAGKTIGPAMTAEQLKKTSDVCTPNQSSVFIASLSGPEERVTIAMNAIGNKFRTTVDDNTSPSYAGMKLTAGPIEVTTEPSAASIMEILTRAMVGVAVGLLIAFLYLFLRISLNNKIRGPEDLQELADNAALIASGLNDTVQLLSQGLPCLSVGPGENVIAISEIDFKATDLARGLTSTAVRSRASVALTDLDLASYPLGNTQGLTDAADQHATLVDVVPPTDGIGVAGTGGPVPNPGKFLTHTGYAQALRELDATHDRVLADTGPLTASSVGVLGTELAGATLLVVRRGTNSRRDVAQALNLVEATGVKVAGLVLP